MTAPLPPLTLILGGARSGKSARAEALIGARPAVYVATAQVWDAEMADRVAHHRARRPESQWQTVEEPRDLVGLLGRDVGGRPVLIDCLTLWLTNVLLDDGADVEAECAALIAALAAAPGPVLCVANEVGLGIVPDNPLARRFRDAAGRLNQDVAAVAQRVEFIAAGLPLVLKG